MDDGRLRSFDCAQDRGWNVGSARRLGLGKGWLWKQWDADLQDECRSLSPYGTQMAHLRWPGQIFSDPFLFFYLAPLKEPTRDPKRFRKSRR